METSGRFIFLSRRIKSKNNGSICCLLLHNLKIIFYKFVVLSKLFYMSELAPLISDLALIMVCAGIMTLIFKRLKQPLVLGYIVAGFVASPHFQLTPSVTELSSIHTWSEIGVIFLLFALGLDFSLKKLMKVGGSAIISACAIILSMIMVGISVGYMFGWKQMDCIYLGGMLAMSSTTIIYKAFEDLGLRQHRFTGLVLSILILEDILAIVLMVMLSTIAVRKNFEGMEMIYSITKLIFFLILWFVVGIYLIPIFLKRVRKLLTDETLLIVALALCLGMVVLASKVGFSPAFGAFIMGSILAETIDAERIEKSIAPVKDLFGAIFFVSVGMMVDPNMILEYWAPILAIVVAILLGQTILGTAGVLLSGQSLKTSMQCGFSLTQIGEFAFIIASLGVSLNVTSNFLYPIVVAVSVITTFLTPYMIRLSVPAYNLVERHLPSKWKLLLERYSAGTQTVNRESHWRNLLSAVLRIVLVYSVLSVATIIISFHLIVPVIVDAVGVAWGDLAAVIITLILISPFLRALIMKKNRSIEFRALWADSRFNHAPLISLILLRVVIGIGFVVYVIETLYQTSVAIGVGISIVVVALMIFSRFLKKQSIVLERTFVQNLRSKDMKKEYLGKQRPAYAGHLLDRDIHFSDFSIPADSLWAGQTLKELDFGRKYGVHITSIIRGEHRINIPGAVTRVFPNDTLQVIGTDEQLSAFALHAANVAEAQKDEDFEKHEMYLKQFVVDKRSSFIGRSIRESGIRNKYRCLVVGIETVEDESLHSPDVDAPLSAGDVVWVVGEEDALKRLFSEK